MKYIFFLLFLSSSLSIIAQTYIVKGTITDESQEPLIAVTVQVKGTARAVLCDLDGNYQIEVMNGDVLIFQYLGYIPQEIKCNGQTEINVRLAEDGNLLTDDPVYYSYPSIAKRIDMSSAVTQIVERTTDHRAVGQTNSLEIINGMGTGFYLSQQDNNIFNPLAGIRSGIGNIGGEVKYVVDGIAGAPFNLADVLSIEVVKGSPSVLNYSNATAPGGIMYIETYNPGREGRSFEANAWIGVKEAISLLPNNDKKLYGEELQTALVQHYDIKFYDQRSLSNGPLNVAGFVSYDKIGGSIRGTNAQRLTPHLTFDYRFFKWIKLNQMVYYDRQEQDNRWLYNSDIAATQNTVILPDLKNLWNKTNIRNELFTASTIKISPWSWMDIVSTFSYDWIDTRGNRANQNFYYTSYRDYFDFRTQENSRTDRWIWDNSVNARHVFGYDHEVSLKAGFLRDIVELKTKMPALTSTNAEQEWNRNIITNNMLLKSTYNYNMGTRTLSASIRQLSSSLLDKDNKRTYLPTVAAGWKFTRERFTHWPDFLYTGKIKAGWGKTAHTSLYMPVTQTDGYGYPDFTYSGLKWQTTEQVDAGVEFCLFNYKFNFTADYYYKITNNILENHSTTPATMHISSGRANIVNHGWEFSMSYENSYFDNYRWGWRAKGNMTINNSSIKNRPENTRLIVGNYIAPKYNYGIEGNIWIENISITTRFTGVNGLHMQRAAFAIPFNEDYTKINYFTFGALNVSYSPRLRFIGGHSRINIYANIENIFYITNSSLKNEQYIDYVRYPINRMFSAGFKLFL